MMNYHQKRTKCLIYLIILIDSVYKDNKIYVEILLDKCKYIVKDKIIKWFITEDWTYSDDNLDDESDHYWDEFKNSW